MYELRQFPQGLWVPSADILNTQLTKLDWLIIQHQSQPDDLKSERAVIQSQINYQRNAAIPISRIPVETLSQIFEYCIEGTSKCAGQLLLVCRQWYAVAAKHKALWTHLTLDDSFSDRYGAWRREKSFIDACYERCGILGLHISFDMSNFDPADYEDPEYDAKVLDGFNAAFLLLENLFQRDMSRWKTFYFYSLEFSSDDEDILVKCDFFRPDILDSLTQQAVHLEKIHIDDNARYFIPILALPSTELSLTSLRLCCAQWEWESHRMGANSFPHVKYIHLTGMRASDWDWFMNSQGQWLQVFPQLEYLVLKSTETSLAVQLTALQQTQTGTALPVPSLRQLYLIGLVPHALLLSVRLPALDTLQLDCNQANLYSIEGTAHKQYAPTVKTLVLRGDPFSHDRTNWSIEKVANFILPLKELRRIIISKRMWDRIRPQIGDKLTPKTIMLDGQVAYQIDAPSFVGELENLLKHS